ncbi:hypothetical protein HYT52_02425 [Candidatus Woesearchaeota archaeon]|nr:hypothetical protein [Candidatus Woesearchaeota archaeon]
MADYLSQKIRNERDGLHHLVKDCLSAVERTVGRGRFQLSNQGTQYCEAGDYCPLQELRERGLPYCRGNELHNPNAKEYRAKLEATRRG